MIQDLEAYTDLQGKAVVFWTQNSDHITENFSDDFIALTDDAAEYFIEHGVTLCGTDGLSIKKRGLNDNRAHTAFLSKGISIIEGLDFNHSLETYKKHMKLLHCH